MKIGFFDSGLGGLTILKKIIKVIPGEYVYIADNLNAPYGLKDAQTVQTLSMHNVEILINCGCKIIVVACNTATSVCIDLLREKFPNVLFIGTEPAIKPAVINSNGKRILITATSLTLHESKLQNLIADLNAKNFVDLLPLGELVEFADKSNYIEYEKAYNYLKNILSIYDLTNYSGIVLGCTHFPIFINEFKKLLPPTVLIYDSSIGILHRLQEVIKINNLTLDSNTTFKLLLTNESDSFRKKAIDYIQS